MNRKKKFDLNEQFLCPQHDVAEWIYNLCLLLIYEIVWVKVQKLKHLSLVFRSKLELKQATAYDLIWGSKPRYVIAKRFGKKPFKIKSFLIQSVFFSFIF